MVTLHILILSQPFPKQSAPEPRSLRIIRVPILAIYAIPHNFGVAFGKLTDRERSEIEADETTNPWRDRPGISERTSSCACCAVACKSLCIFVERARRVTRN